MKTVESIGKPESPPAFWTPRRLVRLQSRGRFATAMLWAINATTPALAAPAEPTCPNILLIVPDQLRAQSVGCMGNQEVQTPNIDRLAAEGMLFHRTYANVPVCCPARAVLLTGTYPQANGMVANDLQLRGSATTIAEILRDAGYRTGFVGKWHLDGGPRLPGFVPPGPRRQGFDFWAAYECHHEHFLPWYFRDTPEKIVVQKFEPEATCDFAVEFLQTQPANAPFFLTVQMGPPHDPYGAPEQYLKRYDPEKLTMRENWRAGSENLPERMGVPPGLRGTAVGDCHYVRTGGREEIAAYYAAITAIDDQVGRILRVLRDRGFQDNTIVLFTSDHGDMLGSHGMRRKRKPHEESARIPAILRWPDRVPKGRIVDTLFSHVDMAPTLLALAGFAVPKHMQGHDLSRVALGRTTRGPDAVLLQIFVPYGPDGISTPWRGMVTERYTYARFESEPWVLFDNQNDPAQMTNLAAESEHEQLLLQLDRRLAALMKRNGDAWAFNRHEPVEEGERLYKHRAFLTIQDWLDWAKAHPDKAN